MENEKIEIFRTNENLKQGIEALKENGYKYIVKCCDKLLSGWGLAENKKHIQLIACKDNTELEGILKDVRSDKQMSYIDWNYIDNYTSIRSWTKGKSWTLRNDWTRWKN